MRSYSSSCQHYTRCTLRAVQIIRANTFEPCSIRRSSLARPVWEPTAIAIGRRWHSAPVVARTGVALSTLRSALAVVVADYAFAHARRLRGYHSRLLDDPITSRVPMAILTQRFWLEKIIDVALNRSRIRTSLSEEVDGPIHASHARVSKATVGRGEMADCPCQCKWLRPALTGCAAMQSWGLS